MLRRQALLSCLSAPFARLVPKPGEKPSELDIYADMMSMKKADWDLDPRPPGPGWHAWDASPDVVVLWRIKPREGLR